VLFFIPISKNCTIKINKNSTRNHRITRSLVGELIMSSVSLTLTELVRDLSLVGVRNEELNDRG